MLQVGSFRERERAECCPGRLTKRVSTRLSRSPTAGRDETAYRVQVGPYAELVAAQEIAQDLFAKNGQRSLIRQFPAAREAG